MNAGTICQRVLYTVGRRDEVVRAAQLMREKHVGYLVVAEPDASAGFPRAIGVLTDRDIVVSVVAREVDPRSVRVGDVMTSNPITVRESDSIEQVVHVMAGAGIRRVPVLDYRGQVVGVISLDDVLKDIAGDAQDIVAAIRNERKIEGTARP